MTSYPPAPIPDAVIEIDGKSYMRDARGALMPAELVKPMDKLKDEMVRKVMGHAIALSGQVARFKGHVFDDVGALEALLAQDYSVRLGGAKGNIRIYTFDGLYMLEVRVHDRIDFGPELQMAKALVDECLNEWSEDARPEIRAIVTRAFNTDKAGQINRTEIFTLLRMDIEDPRWQSAMRAVRDAMIVIGSKTYIQLKMRPHAQAAWSAITIDLARA